MAISLKKLYLLDEYWTTTDFTHPETGEKDTAQHWETPSGYKNYSAPNVNVTSKSEVDSENRAKSTQIFYDFYAMELLHALLGSSKEMSTGSKIKATLPTAARTGVNPALLGIDWDNVTFPLSNVVLPEKLRSQIDTMYEEVTLTLSHKLQEHLRRSLVQELRHLINHSSHWSSFRNYVVSHYNKNKSLSKEDFKKLVDTHLPNMRNHLDAVKRLLLFSRYYSKMGSNDPGDIVTQDDPKPSKEKDDPSKYYDIEKDPKAIDISKEKPEDSDKDTETPEKEIPDYQGWEQDADTQLDPSDPFDKKNKKQWKDKLKEDYASGRLSPSTIREINKAILKSGLTWPDIVLAYKNIDWSSGFGGEKWGEGVIAYLDLVKATKSNDLDKIASSIDHIYDLSHNNGPLLNKGGMFVRGEDLDRRSKVTHIARFLPDVSPAVNKLILRFLHYLPGTDPEVEKNIDAFINSPLGNFTPEQEAKLISYNLVKTGVSFLAKVPFTNKQGKNISRKLFINPHKNGKFSINDSIKADSRVFNTFEELENHIKNVVSKELESPKASSYSPYDNSNPPPPAQPFAVDIDNYIKSHVRIKLPPDKAQILLDTCKMGWREKGQYYKAYFQTAKRAMFYAFTDGTYLVITNEYKHFNPSKVWDYVLGYAVELTKDAIPYPEPEKAKAHIYGNISNISQTTPTLHEPKTSLTPDLYKDVSKLPPPASSKTIYTLHSGLAYPPTTSIRLDNEDDAKLMNIGFYPKMESVGVIYIHKGTKDIVKFFPNNTSRLIFSTSIGKKSIPTITFDITKMLAWLPMKYGHDTSISPLSNFSSMSSEKPSDKTKTPVTAGINPGSLFNPQIQAAGFKWDQSSGTYIDGNNSLMIKPNRSSLLYFEDGNMKQFKNLPELIAYLTSSYPTEKKTNAVAPKNPTPLNEPETTGFPEISTSSISLTEEERNYIDALVKTNKGWSTHSNSNYIGINKPSPPNDLGGMIFYINKDAGFYKICKTTDNSILYKSAGFNTISEMLKKIIASNGGDGNGGTSIPEPTQPTPNGGSELPNSNYQAIANELIAEIAQVINKTPEEVGNTTSFYNSHVLIPVIKAIRTFYKNNNMEQGLAFAKIAGEHWKDFIEYIKDNGLPRMPANGVEKFKMDVVGYASKKNNVPTLNELTSELSKSTGLTLYKVLNTHLGESGDTIKVNAVKTLRNFYNKYGMGNSFSLAHAKAAIEHWPNFISFIQDNETFPYMPAQYSSSTIFDKALNYKNIQMKEFKEKLNKHYGGVQLDSFADSNFKSKGFEWDDNSKTYVNKKLYQFIVVKKQTGFNSYNIYWVDKNGVLKLKSTLEIYEVYVSIGDDGSIKKSEDANNKVYDDYNKIKPNVFQEDLLKKLGFIDKSSGDVIHYFKPSSDSGNAYFILDVNPNTGKVDYQEIDEDEGVAIESYLYPSLAHALTFLKNKFASELDNYVSADEDDIPENVKEITDKLSKIGFYYTKNSGILYEYFTKDLSEFVSYNSESGNIVYSIKSAQDVYDVTKSFFEIDKFIEYYNSKKSYSKLSSVIEKFGFKVITNDDSVIKWRRDALKDNAYDYYVTFMKVSKTVNYLAFNNDTDDEIIKQSFADVDTAINFLKFKFDLQSFEIVPFSEFDYKNLNKAESPYQTIRLTQFDESVLRDIGFVYHKNISIGQTPTGTQVNVSGYLSIDGRQIFVYGDGTALFKNNGTDKGSLFPTVKSLFEYLWAKVDWNSVPEFTKKNIKFKTYAKPIIPTKSGEMPYSGYDYKLLSSLYDKNPTESSYLSEIDDAVMKDMGFERKSDNTSDIAFQYFYAKGNYKMYFLSNGRSVYWEGDNGPKYFNTVYDGMKFLWDKHATYIEEVISYKNFMKDWI